MGYGVGWLLSEPRFPGFKDFQDECEKQVG